MICIMSCKTEFKFLTHSNKMLWSSTEISEQIKTKIDKNAYRFDKRVLTFVIAVFCGALWISAPPILNADINLFLGGTVKKEYHLLAAFFESLVIYLTALMVLATNTYFAGLCMSFSMQFELLNVQLQNLFHRFNTEEQQYKEIVKCIRRHSVLLRCVRMLRKALSLFYLTALGINMLTIFIECYKASENFDDLTKAGESALLAVCLIIQLTFYCLPATRLTEKVDIKKYN